MIDKQTYEDIKQKQREGHTFTYITMALDLDDDIVKIVMDTKNYAEFEQSMQEITI